MPRVQRCPSGANVTTSAGSRSRTNVEGAGPITTSSRSIASSTLATRPKGQRGGAEANDLAVGGFGVSAHEVDGVSNRIGVVEVAVETFERNAEGG